MSTTPPSSPVFSFSRSALLDLRRALAEEQVLANRVDALIRPIVSEPPHKRARLEPSNISSRSFSLGASKTPSLRPPPTPRRAMITCGLQARAYARAKEYAGLSEENLLRKLKTNYQDVKISELHYIGKGDVFTVYRMNWNGSLQVIGIPHFEIIVAPQGFIRTMHGEVKNYYRLKEINFPVVDIFNFDPIYESKSFFKDLFEGFRRSAYVPHEFMSYENLSKLEEKMSTMSEEGLQICEKVLQEQNSPIYQLKEMFHLAYQKGVPADLKWDNIGIQKNGKVVLFDLYYDAEDDCEGENPFHCLVEQKLRTFATEGSPLWKYLDPRPAI